MKTWALLLALLTLAPAASAERLASYGPAPAGYSWFTAKEAGAALLKPDAWFTKVEMKGDTGALFITKEDIAAFGEFQTGLSLNFVHDVRVKTGRKSSEYAFVLLQGLLKGNEELSSFANPSDGMLGIGLRLRDKKLDKIIHYYLVANDAGDTLHIFIFEAPAKDWDAAWAIGEPIFRKLRLIFPGQDAATAP